MFLLIGLNFREIRMAKYCKVDRFLSDYMRRRFDKFTSCQIPKYRHTPFLRRGCAGKVVAGMCYFNLSADLENLINDVVPS